VNGKPMPQNQSVPLNPGDVLRIGDYTMTLVTATGSWDAFDALSPTAEVDLFESWESPKKPSINIDDLLADLGSPAQPAQSHPDMSSVPLLAQRMYVGSQQAEAGALHHHNAQSSATPSSVEMEKLQHLLGICAQGCMQLLAARRIFKEETGSKLTSISGKGNNPLKFSASSAEALTKLLGENSLAYLPADQAFEQAFQDLREHMQLSVARIQTLIDQIQGNLDPALIEQEVNKQGGLSLSLEVARKARLWDLYCEKYQQLVSTWS
jgi:type VI secretion system protein ImpI